MKQNIVSWLKTDSGVGPRWLLILCALAAAYAALGLGPYSDWYYPVR